MGDVKNYNRSKEAIEKIRDIAKDTNIGMLCTNLTNLPISTCPMATQEVDEHGDIWFMSAKGSTVFCRCMVRQKCCMTAKRSKNYGSRMLKSGFKKAKMIPILRSFVFRRKKATTGIRKVIKWWLS